MAEEKKKGRGCLYAFGCLAVLALGLVGFLFLGGVGLGAGVWYTGQQLDKSFDKVAKEMERAEAAEREMIEAMGADEPAPEPAGTVDEEPAPAPKPVAAPEPAPEPDPKPAPKPEEPEPEPEPEPAPRPDPKPEPAPAPKPKPTTSGSASRTGGGTPNVTASGADVTLISGSGKRFKLPASVPGGTYTIEATFSDGSPVETGSIRVSDGGTHSVTCRESMGICRGM